MTTFIKKKISEVAIGQQPWMKEKNTTRITVKDSETNELNTMRPLTYTAKVKNLYKQRKMTHLTFRVPNGSNFSKLIDQYI